MKYEHTHRRGEKLKMDPLSLKFIIYFVLLTHSGSELSNQIAAGLTVVSELIV